MRASLSEPVTMVSTRAMRETSSPTFGCSPARTDIGPAPFSSASGRSGAWKYESTRLRSDFALPT